MNTAWTDTFNFKTWNRFERLWVALFLLAGTVVTVVSKDSLLNYFILVTGVLCVLLAAKGNLWTYAFGLVNSLAYGYVAFANGLYGDMALNLLFFAPTNVIGFVMWRRHLDHGAVEMRGLGAGPRWLVGLGCVVLIGGLGYALSGIKTQNIPYVDATSTILSIVATLLMMWRYKEQWILYIVLNLVTIGMWVIRLFQGSADGSLMIIMWTAFLVNSVYGYVTWHRGSRRAAEEAH